MIGTIVKSPDGTIATVVGFDSDLKLWFCFINGAKCFINGEDWTAIKPLTGKELFDAWEDVMRIIATSWIEKKKSIGEVVGELDKEWKIGKGAGVRQDGIVPCDAPVDSRI